MAGVRCFVAIELEEALRQRLVDVQTALRAQCGTAVRWVSPDNIHLTLFFLGNVQSPSCPRCRRNLAG